MTLSFDAFRLRATHLSSKAVSGSGQSCLSTCGFASPLRKYAGLDRSVSLTRPRERSTELTVPAAFSSAGHLSGTAALPQLPSPCKTGLPKPMKGLGAGFDCRVFERSASRLLTAGSSATSVRTPSQAVFPSTARSLVSAMAGFSVTNTDIGTSASGPDATISSRLPAMRGHDNRAFRSGAAGAAMLTARCQDTEAVCSIGARATPLASSASRTARATLTASGSSPCTQSVSTSTFMRPPSAVASVSPRARQSACAAAAAGSAITEPGHRARHQRSILAVEPVAKPLARETQAATFRRLLHLRSGQANQDEASHRRS